MDITRSPTIKWSGLESGGLWHPAIVAISPASRAAVELFSRRTVRCPWKGRSRPGWRSIPMNGIIYLVGLIVVIMFILSFLGLR